MATFVVAHGAWSAGWAWKKMRPLMRGAGHELWTPTYTGLGERAHLGHADVNLDTHIQDIVGGARDRGPHDVILIGHSYGGMVATGVADRARDRIAQLVYLDAFAPEDGTGDLRSGAAGHRRQMRRRRSGKPAALAFRQTRCRPIPRRRIVAWAAPRRRPQPLKAFDAKLKLSAEPSAPRTYIYCKACRHRRHVRAFYAARAARGLAHLRDRREPQPAHHQSAGAARDPERDRRA